MTDLFSSGENENESEQRLIEDIAAGVADRLRLLALSIDRLDRLESGSGEWLGGFVETELPEASVELALRALRTAADPLNFALLQALAADESRYMGQLVESVGLGRLALTERLNDLIQVGLASRNIDTDHAQITAAGMGMVELIKALVAGVAEMVKSKIED